MKKIPTLFEREFKDGKVSWIKPIVHPGMEWVLEGKGAATIKYDGSCCMVRNGELYKRFDAKPGRKIPSGAIPCCEPDPVTGHHPHWVKCSRDNPADKWFFKAKENCIGTGYPIVNRTYEAIGKHFNGNPYNFNHDILILHGIDIINPDKLERTFDGIREFLKVHKIEGIVFWKDGTPQCKIKRTDFGFEWPVKFENTGNR